MISITNLVGDEGTASYNRNHDFPQTFIKKIFLELVAWAMLARK